MSVKRVHCCTREYALIRRLAYRKFTDRKIAKRLGLPLAYVRAVLAGEEPRR